MLCNQCFAFYLLTDKVTNSQNVSTLKSIDYNVAMTFILNNINNNNNNLASTFKRYPFETRNVVYAIPSHISGE